MSEISPDTCDWTDVLAGRCSECGFTGTEDPTGVPSTLAEAAATWQTVLTRADATERRSPDRWSDVEYAAHMHDVLDEFRRRTERMLAETDPTLDNFDGDAVAVDSDYAHQNSAEVAPPCVRTLSPIPASCPRSAGRNGTGAASAPTVMPSPSPHSRSTDSTKSGTTSATSGPKGTTETTVER